MSWSRPASVGKETKVERTWNVPGGYRGKILFVELSKIEPKNSEENIFFTSFCRRQ